MKYIGLKLAALAAAALMASTGFAAVTHVPFGFYASNVGIPDAALTVSLQVSSSFGDPTWIPGTNTITVANGNTSGNSLAFYYLANSALTGTMHITYSASQDKGPIFIQKTHDVSITNNVLAPVDVLDDDTCEFKTGMSGNGWPEIQVIC